MTRISDAAILAPMLTSYRDVMSLWRTRAALARFIGVKAERVRTWWALDAIPEKHFVAIVDAAERCQFPGVTYALLTSLTEGASINPKE